MKCYSCGEDGVTIDEEYDTDRIFGSRVMQLGYYIHCADCESNDSAATPEEAKELYDMLLESNLSHLSFLSSRREELESSLIRIIEENSKDNNPYEFVFDDFEIDNGAWIRWEYRETESYSGVAILLPLSTLSDDAKLKRYLEISKNYDMLRRYVADLFGVRKKVEILMDSVNLVKSIEEDMNK